jgi:hypothetical protein
MGPGTDVLAQFTFVHLLHKYLPMPEMETYSEYFLEYLENFLKKLPIWKFLKFLLGTKRNKTL